MDVPHFTQTEFVNGRSGLERPHSFNKTPFEIGGKQVVLAYAAGRGSVDKYDLVPPAYVRDDTCVGNITFLAGLGHEKQPVAGLDFIDLAHFLPELGLLPRNAGYFDTHFGIHLANEAGAVDALFVIAAGAVGCARVGAGYLDYLGYVCSIGVAGARVSRGSM